MVPQPFHLYGGTYSFGGLAVIQSLHLPYMVGRGLLFQVVSHPHDMVNSESVVGIKPHDSDVVIGYQVDKFTCTWLVEGFVAQSHMYPGFKGKVSTLTHFPLQWGCEVYSFLDQAVKQLWAWSWFYPYGLSTHQNWMLPFRRLKPCLLLSLNGFCACLVPNPITLDAVCS